MLILYLDSHTELTPIERIKAIELKLMQLERDHPTWAAIHFNQPASDVSLHPRRC